jgi:hypothetical protein
MNKKRLFLTLLLAVSSLSIKAMQREEPAEEETEEEQINLTEILSPMVQQWINEVKKATNDPSQAEKFIVAKLNLPENKNLQNDFSFLYQLIIGLSKEYNQKEFYFLRVIKNPIFIDQFAKAAYANKNRAFPNSLIQATIKGDKLAVVIYLHKRENPNQSDQFGRTPLHFAGHYPEIVNALLRKGANPNAVDSWGDTPLLNAVKAPNIESVKLLLAAGANPNPRPNMRRETPLTIAAIRDLHEIRKILSDAMYTIPHTVPAKRAKK